MASISVPCPKISFVDRVGSTCGQQQKQMVSFPISSNPNPSSLSFGSSALSGFQCPNKKQSAVWKVHAKVNEVTTKKPLNSAPAVDIKPKVASSEGKVESPETKIPNASALSAFMTQVSDIVKLVDSRDIVELQMKQSDCELIIRKKEALQQPVPAVTMPPPHMMYPTPPPASAPASAPASPASAASPLALPPPAKPASSHPQLKCPMAGTFYRCPGPGEPPFVKVGDKVQKGQIICIIEAMKLMNEIEADQSGTITEILVEDGKQVSIDTPLFVIVP